MELPEGANMMAPKRFYFSLELFPFETWTFELVKVISENVISRQF